MSEPAPRREGPRFAALGGRDDAPAGASRLDLNTAPAESAGYRERLAQALERVSLAAYGDERALPLREALAAHEAIPAERIFVAGGSMAVLERLLSAFAGPGASAISFDPGYAGCERLCEALRIELRRAGRAHDFSLDPERVEAAIAAGAAPDVVLFCHPGNPTGQAERPDSVGRACDLLPGSLIVVDEAYVDFAAAGTMAGLLGEHPNLAIVRTFSKAWALAGARLGYALASERIVAELFERQLPGAVSALTQAAGIAALAEDAGARRERIAAICRERDRIGAALDRMPGVQAWPSEANFVLFRVPGAAADVLAACTEAGVLIRDMGARQGMEDCLRVTVGEPDANERFLAAAVSVRAGVGAAR